MGINSRDLRSVLQCRCELLAGVRPARCAGLSGGSPWVDKTRHITRFRVWKNNEKHYCARSLHFRDRLIKRPEGESAKNPSPPEQRCGCALVFPPAESCYIGQQSPRKRAYAVQSSMIRVNFMKIAFLNRTHATYICAM